MALTPEQLQQAVMRYRGGVDLSGGSLQPQPMDPALTQPLTPMVDAPAPMPVVQPLAPSSVSAMNPGSYRQGIQQSIDAYRGATNEAMANAQAMGGAKSSNADRIADLYASRADEIGADAGPDRTASTASRAAADEKMAAYEAANKEAENTQIQRDRRTDGQKAMGVIGMALAGLGDAMSRRGGQSSNYLQNVQQSIQDEIQRDVEDQRMALQDKRAAAQSRLSEYGLARQAFGDDKDAEDRAYNLAMSKATMRHAAQVDEYAARAESETAKLGANALSAKLKSDAALQELQAWQGLEEQRMRSMGRGGSGQQGMSPELQYRMMRDALNDSRDPSVQAQQAGTQLTGDLIVTNPKVAQFHAKNAEKVQGAVDTAREAARIIDEIIETRKNSSDLGGRAQRKNPFSDTNALLQEKQGSLDIMLKSIDELGVLAGPDMALIRSKTGDATSVMDATDTKLKELRNDILGGAGRAASSRGFADPFDGMYETRKSGAGNGGGNAGSGTSNRGADRIRGAVNAPQRNAPSPSPAQASNDRPIWTPGKK